MRDPSSEEPQYPVEALLDIGIQAIERAAKERGGEVQHLALFAWVTGLGKPDGASAGVGFEDSLDLLSFLTSQAQSMAKAHGISMELMSIDKPIGEG